MPLWPKACITYTSTMKISNIRALRGVALLSLLCCLGSIGMMAQNISTPYSMYGYGVLQDNATSAQRQMGGVGYAMNSGRQINVMNPASYAFADSMTFLWDIGADLCFVNYRENNIKESKIGGGLDYLTMKVPLSKNFGASIGLLPVSSVGYAFGNEIEFGAMENQGHGGINQLYLGLAGQWKGLALGANVSYQFGTIVNDVYSSPQNAGRTLFEHVMEIRDWNINVGLQYSLNITRQDRLTIGATWSPKKSMRGHTWVTNQQLTTTESGQTYLPDTVAYMSMKNRYYQPMTIGAGINYTRLDSYRLMVEADLTWQNWSKAKYSSLFSADDKLVFQGMNFNDRFRVALGAEFTPKVRGSYLKRITWRFGGSYGRDYLKIQDNQIKDITLSFGAGLPTPGQKTVINLGFEWRHRACSPAKLITENYFNIMLGVNFNEVWFWQRKIK